MQSDGRSTLDVTVLRISLIDDNWCKTKLEDWMDLWDAVNGYTIFISNTSGGYLILIEDDLLMESCGN